MAAIYSPYIKLYNSANFPFNIPLLFLGGSIKVILVIDACLFIYVTERKGCWCTPNLVVIAQKKMVVRQSVSQVVYH